MNLLLFGDNLKWLQDTKVFPDASVDLVYLDPPLNSNANYNVLFKGAEQRGKLRDERTKCEPRPERTRRMVEAVKKFLKPRQTRRADVVSAQTSPMMSPRLVELHRVWKQVR